MSGSFSHLWVIQDGKRRAANTRYPDCSPAVSPPTDSRLGKTIIDFFKALIGLKIGRRDVGEGPSQRSVTSLFPLTRGDRRIGASLKCGPIFATQLFERFASKFGHICDSYFLQASVESPAMRCFSAAATLGAGGLIRAAIR